MCQLLSLCSASDLICFNSEDVEQQPPATDYWVNPSLPPVSEISVIETIPPCPSDNLQLLLGSLSSRPPLSSVAQDTNINVPLGVEGSSLIYQQQTSNDLWDLGGFGIVLDGATVRSAGLARSGSSATTGYTGRTTPMAGRLTPVSNASSRVSQTNTPLGRSTPTNPDRFTPTLATVGDGLAPVAAAVAVVAGATDAALAEGTITNNSTRTCISSTFIPSSNLFVALPPVPTCELKYAKLGLLLSLLSRLVVCFEIYASFVVHLRTFFCFYVKLLHLEVCKM